MVEGIGMGEITVAQPHSRVALTGGTVRLQILVVEVQMLGKGGMDIIDDNDGDALVGR